MSKFDLAQDGIDRAEHHAEMVRRGWRDEAYDMLIAISRELAPLEFTAPDVRRVAEQRGLPSPPSKRAWGGPFLRAQKSGRIVHTGFDRADREMHSQPIRTWRAA